MFNVTKNTVFGSPLKMKLDQNELNSVIFFVVTSNNNERLFWMKYHCFIFNCNRGLI